MARAGKLFKRLKAARLDNTLDYEMRRLATTELLIIDDLALQPLDLVQHHRLLRAVRRTPPAGRHDRDLQPHPDAMPVDDQKGHQP